MTVQVLAYADLLECNGESLVLRRGGGLVRLSPLGTAMVELAAHPVALEVLASSLEQRFGAPLEETALQLTKRLVADLATVGVLEYRELESPAGTDHD